MAYFVILSSRTECRQLKIVHMGLLSYVWFPISEEMLIAGQMPKCHSNCGSGCPFLLSVMSLGVRFDSVFSTVWFAFSPWPLIFFLNPGYQHNKHKKRLQQRLPLPFLLLNLPLSHTNTHTHTLLLTASSRPWFFAFCLSNIYLCLPRALNECREHMHNSACDRAMVSVSQLWRYPEFKTWKFTDTLIDGGHYSLGGLD